MRSIIFCWTWFDIIIKIWYCGQFSSTFVSSFGIVSQWDRNRRISSTFSRFDHVHVIPSIQYTTIRMASTGLDTPGDSSSDTTSKVDREKGTEVSSSSSSSTLPTQQWVDKDLYQRVFYRFSPSSDIDIHDAIVVEDRCRFRLDPERPDYIIPHGPRTIILRNGCVEDGTIGDDFFTMNVASSNSGSSTTHNGAGNDRDVQNAIICAMYLASNPDLCTGRMIELSATTGLGSLLGCIGAGYVLQYNTNNATLAKNETDISDNILTFGNDNREGGPLPPKLDLLAIADVDHDQLVQILNNIKATNIQHSTLTKKILVDKFDWRIRTVRPRMVQQQQRSSSSSSSSEYHTVVASDIVFSYPETKELARTVAHSLEPIQPYIYNNQKNTNQYPTFVHVCPNERDDVVYLRRILERGYRMLISTKFLKVEKLIFHIQTLPYNANEIELDNLELEMKDCKELIYQAIIGQHHPEYYGENTGEMFFPMETGEYDMTSGQSFFEKDTESSSPW
jgi:hypothetical protein